MKQGKKRKNWKIPRVVDLPDAENGYSESIFALRFFQRILMMMMVVG